MFQYKRFRKLGKASSWASILPNMGVSNTIIL